MINRLEPEGEASGLVPMVLYIYLPNPQAEDMISNIMDKRSRHARIKREEAMLSNVVDVERIQSQV
jgi:hypothetical protein